MVVMGTAWLWSVCCVVDRSRAPRWLGRERLCVEGDALAEVLDIEVDRNALHWRSAFVPPFGPI
ncbi:unnamed protein product [marine sediment metagenome]|uniref:Uncharacterized protein n=1 Tax=marine sediment metagenome TaxID=412755 RepID=X1MZH5_9ZZZZ